MAGLFDKTLFDATHKAVGNLGSSDSVGGAIVGVAISAAADAVSGALLGAGKKLLNDAMSGINKELAPPITPMLTGAKDLSAKVIGDEMKLLKMGLLGQGKTYPSKLDPDTTKYYDNVHNIVQPIINSSIQSGVEHDKDVQNYYSQLDALPKIGEGKWYQSNDARTQIYYAKVLLIYGTMRIIAESRQTKDDKKLTAYYQSLTNFMTFPGKPYEANLSLADNIDSNNAKTDVLKTAGDLGYNTVFGVNPGQQPSTEEGIRQLAQQASRENKNYNEIISIVRTALNDSIGRKQAQPITTIPTEFKAFSDMEAVEKKAWEDLHSYDKVSPEMFTAIFNNLTIKGVIPFRQDQPTSNDLQDLPVNTIGEIGKVSLLLDPAATRIYMNNESYTVKKAEVGGQQTKLYKGIVTSKDATGKVTIEPNTIWTPDSPQGKYIADIIQASSVSAPGGYRFFFEKLHGKESDAAGFNKRRPIDSKLTQDDVPNRMVFAAYIENYNDSYDTNWAEYSFFGRSENFWNYKNTTRSVTLNFFMLSDFSNELLDAAIAEKKLNSGIDSKTIKDELQKTFIDWGQGGYKLPSVTQGADGNYRTFGWVPGQYTYTTEQMWHRMTFLAQCNYPWYRKDGKMKEQPFVRLRIGDFLDVILKIKSLVFDEYEEFNMDLNANTKVGTWPMGVRCALTADVIHMDEPSSNYGEFYHRKDYDSADKFYKTQKQVTSANAPGAGVSKVQAAAIQSGQSSQSPTGGVGAGNVATGTGGGLTSGPGITYSSEQPGTGGPQLEKDKLTKTQKTVNDQNGFSGAGGSW